MDYKKLFVIQRKLKKNIIKHHPETLHDSEKFEKLILALNVEVAETANEVRCFKYWSNKAPSSKKIILEEYVDALHFVLELGIEIGEEIKTVKYIDLIFTSPTVQFNELYESISRFARYRSAITYQVLCNQFFTLGKILGFSDKEIEAAYLKKNIVNHTRQEEGY
ncbi:MAG: dimeric dUTPase (all-alpha-NTP-PPase superfamily) [Clostridium sp.]|jgi:dimeric dUTPase (all-alpha-NTP-PPase superfamily)